MILTRLRFSVAFFVCIGTLVAQSDAVELVRLSEANWDEFAPAGKEADAIYGDWVLRNDHIIVVIADAIVTRNANMTTPGVGGSIIDLTLRKRPNDLLGAYYPAMGRQLQLSEIYADGQLWFDAKSSGVVAPRADQPISAKEFLFVLNAVAQGQKPAVRVEYRLADGDQSVRIETICSNPHKKPITNTSRDYIRADNGFEVGSDDELNLIWVYDSWWQQAYGVLVEGAKPRISAALIKKQPKRGFGWGYQLPGQADNQLQPGDSVSVVRRLIPSRDMLGIKGFARLHASKSLVRATIKFIDKYGPVEGARVDVLVGDNVYGSGRTMPDGELTVSAPAGESTNLRITAPGRSVQNFPLDLVSIVKIEKTIELSTPGIVVAKITDGKEGRIPCKVGFYGKDGTPDPMFGPNTRIHGVQNLWYTANGDFRLALEPGHYEVIVSHGPEFDAVIQDVEVIAGEEFHLDAKLVRTVDTTGWLSADLHSHSSPSGDNTSSQRGRVLNLLAEHLEFIPCTEHNRITTYDAHLEHFAATKLVLTCPGMELTGKLLPINHQNAFPLIHHPHLQDGGGPQVDSNPEVQIERLALWDSGSDKLVQSDHPNLVQMFGDRDMNGKPDAGFRKMFGFMDVVEVHPMDKIFTPPTTLTTTSNDRGNAIFHWMQLLNLGYRIPGVVNTDAHYNFHGSGPFRNFIKSTTDNPAEARVLDMCHAAEQGTLTMTNGPFMEVNASSLDSKGGPGEDIKSDGEVLLSVRVQCPNWIDVNRVQVFINGKPEEKLNFTRRTHPQMFADGVQKFHESIQVHLTGDAHLIVAAAGEGLQLGRVMGPATGKRTPITVSNPIYVDVDGDGFQANGDMLGVPLPGVAEE